MQVSRVLVVDGDHAVRDALVTGLRFVGFEAHGADGTAAARDWLSSAAVDVVVLSDELPDGAPGELVPAHTSRTGAVVLVMANGAANRFSNYRADATLRRPISVGRVVEEVESLLRSRTEKPGAARCDFGMLSLDAADSSVASGSESVRLGRTEARLLRFFM